jgi:hypothetical protein
MICGAAITVQSRYELRAPSTLGIIPANPTPECVYLDCRVLHKYGIASEHDCDVGPGPGTRMRSGTLLDTSTHSHRWPRFDPADRKSRHSWKLLVSSLTVRSNDFGGSVRPTVELHCGTWRFHSSQAKSAAWPALAEDETLLHPKRFRAPSPPLPTNIRLRNTG